MKFTTPALLGAESGFPLLEKGGHCIMRGGGVWVSGGRTIPRGHRHRSRTLAQLHALRRGSMCSYPKETNHCNKNTWPFPQCQG